MSTVEFDEGVRHELETDIRRDFLERRALIAAGIEASAPVCQQLMAVINARLDIYPYGESRSNAVPAPPNLAMPHTAIQAFGIRRS